MKKLNLSAKIALCFVGIAAVLSFVAVCCAAYQEVAYKLFGVAAIIAASGVLVFTLTRMFLKKGIRAKLITGAIPMALIWFIIEVLYIVFFHECKALGVTGGILMCIAGAWMMTAFVLFQIDEAKQIKKMKGEA